MNITQDDVRARPKFTEQQIENWRAYENVRASAAYNMWAPQAQAATGLTKADYFFVMENFDALKEAAESSA